MIASWSRCPLFPLLAEPMNSEKHHSERVLGMPKDIRSDTGPFRDIKRNGKKPPRNTPVDSARSSNQTLTTSMKQLFYRPRVLRGKDRASQF